MTQTSTVEPESQAAGAAPAVEVHTVDLPNATDTGARVHAGQLDILLDTTVEITARLGDARMPARQLLELGPGAVVRLEKMAGEPVELILNGACFAKGNLVLVGDQLGIRIREILSAPAAAGPPA
jgi:flagellar motor switch protein FliN/FliY